MTGLFTPTCFNEFIILPGIDPMYVLLCPLISASSLNPPNEILVNFLFIERATEFASEVLPTPGGPTRHIIDPLSVLFNFFTARNSRILAFTSSSP